MRTAVRFLNDVVVLAMCGAGTASAQHPQTREGFWIGFGLGAGSAHGTCNYCLSASEGGTTAFLKLGGTLGAKVLLGGAVNAFRKASGETEYLGNVTASLYYYPAAASGFFVSGGLGISQYASVGGNNSRGWGFTASSGYDIRIARMTSVTPVVDFTYGGGLSPGGYGGWKQTVIDVSLGITFH